MASKVMRLAIGVFLLLIGAFAAVIAVINLGIRLGHDQPIDALFLTQFVLYAVVGLAYLTFGVWNLLTFAMTRRAPLVAALIEAVVGLLFGAFYVANLHGPAQLTQGLGIGLNVAIIVLAWVLLRRKTPADEE
ncbi:hypothetical protein SPF06_04755 [Sinomonas sp. JGH33]|uniref:Uncharacterized protein n=1 Tax=Sinomonas terricola TaxID=3110330 RepID=A0ABU5T318_9MICC|nr:hypothetical protein [Sinomonas sp. JGH33]MEA5454028.1 hypothetical protein [Sinomonas sp. JGH33]